MIVCKKCKVPQSEISFARNRRVKSGRFIYCKSCQKIYYFQIKDRLYAWKKRNIIKCRFYNKKYRQTERGRLADIRGQLKWQKVHRLHANLYRLMRIQRIRKGTWIPGHNKVYSKAKKLISQVVK